MSGFVKNFDEVCPCLGQDGVGQPSIFHQCQVSTILYETKPEIIARILPPPLEPLDKPYVLLVFNDFLHTNFGRPYMEPNVQIPCKYKGVPGNYIAGMTLSDDMATFGGREVSGYPKKVGFITQQWDGKKFIGTSARHGIEYVKMTIDYSKPPQDPAVADILTKLTAPGQHGVAGKEDLSVNFNFKMPIVPAGMAKLPGMKASLARNWKYVRLYEEPVYGEAQIEYTWSDDDPWAELEVVRILGAKFVHSYVELRETDLLEEIPLIDYMPYGTNKADAGREWDKPDFDYMAYREEWKKRGGGIIKSEY